MAAFAFVPDYFRARDGARVQLVARAAERCDLAVEEMLRDGAATNRADVTAAMVDRWLADRGRNPVYWPNGTDLSTLDLADPAGTSVEVALRGGARRVSAADRRDDSDLSDR